MQVYIYLNTQSSIIALFLGSTRNSPRTWVPTTLSQFLDPSNGLAQLHLLQAIGSWTRKMENTSFSVCYPAFLSLLSLPFFCVCVSLFHHPIFQTNISYFCGFFETAQRKLIDIPYTLCECTQQSIHILSNGTLEHKTEDTALSICKYM